MKVANPAHQARPVRLAFEGRGFTTARAEVLSGSDPGAGNTLEEPDNIVPRASVLHGSDGVFDYEAPANSLTVLTLTGHR